MTLAVLFPFLMAAVCALLGPQLGRRTGYFAAAGFLPALALIPRLFALPAAAPVSEVTRWVPELGLNLVFRGDGFSLLFAALIGVIGTLATLYSVAYLSAGEKFGRFYPYLLLFGGSMLGLVLSDNLVALFGFWEMTSVTSFLLIGLWHTRSAARDGAVKAFLISALGGLGLLAAAAMLSIAGGSTNLSELDLSAVRASPLFVPALLCTLLAAFTKSAQLPFHIWLPTAMEAPTPISAFLHSATMVKAGVVLVAKFGLIFGGSALWSGIIVPLGVATLRDQFADVEDDAGRFALMSWFFEEKLAGFTPYAAGSPPLGFQIIGTSGTVTTVAASHLGLRRYDRTKVDGLSMTTDQIDRVIHDYLALGPEGRRADPRIGRERHALIMSGVAILQTLMRVWPTTRLSVADRGLREGLLYSQMVHDGVITPEGLEGVA